MSNGPVESESSSRALMVDGIIEHRSHKIPIVFAVVMILLALIGVGLTMANAAGAKNYWVVLVPVYGLLCIVTAYFDKGAQRTMVLRQVLHWSGVGVAIYLDLVFIRGTGEQTSMATGFSSLLILALGCFLAGVNIEWPFAFVGAFLALALIALVVAQQYMLLLVALGSAVLAAMLITYRLVHKKA